MTNPTSNYGFVLPTSTDLVTDLPADFEVALQGVDTRLKALQPGTTLGDIAYSSATANTNTRLPIGSNGQVLGVAAGVPAWVAADPLVILDAKGDLITATAADTPARLAVGTNGQTLVADSSTATGLKWATPATAASGLTHIKTASFSAVSDTGTTFDNVLSSTYTSYQIMYSVYGSAGTAALQMQLRYAGPTTQAATYYWLNNVVEGAGPSATYSRNTSDSSIQVSKYVAGGGRGTRGMVNLFMNDYSAANRVAYLFNCFFMDYEGQDIGGGYQDTGRTYTGFLFKPASGTLTGTVSVYGLALS